MPRLVNGERQITNPKPENAGKLLIFCEGYTEYNYLDYFKQYLDNNYILDYSNLLFETWLVMHFQNVEPGQDNSKRAIIKLMREYLDVTRYTSQIKAAKGTIGKILGSNGNEKIRAAIENAKVLEEYWKMEGKDMDNHIVEMNPVVEIYKLVEITEINAEFQAEYYM